MKENERFKTNSLPEVRKTFGLRDRGCKGFDILATAAQRCEVGGYLHGLRSERKITSWHSLACS
jgi:hypothetical protein